MAGRCWMESSLNRSSKLGIEVLQKAKRRSETWKSVRSAQRSGFGSEKHTEEVLERPAAHTTFDNAFGKIVECMSETSNQCKKVYRSAPAAELHEQERKHVCRFHTKLPQQTSRRTQAPTVTSERAHCTRRVQVQKPFVYTGSSKSQKTPDIRIEGLSEPEDFLIDVPPGTYSITAAMQNAGPQTRVVHIKAGESMRLTFNL